MKPEKILPVLILLLCSAPATAEIHKCTGADGTVQFSDIPCGATHKTIKPLKPGASTSESQRNSKRDKLLRAYQDERNLKQRNAADEKSKRIVRKKKCNYARDRLRQLILAGRLYELDGTGKRVVLADVEREKTTDQARKNVEYWCD